jgi:hypothetical protein
MQPPNKPITSREYKLMLNTDRFKDREEGSDLFWALLAWLVERQGGEPKKKTEEKDRRVWYLDTPGQELRQKGFVLRLREEMEAAKRHKLTLKHRHPDRYLSASRKVTASKVAENKYEEEDKDIKTKFEEDILRQSVSKFAHSTSIRMSDRSDLGTMADVIAIFDGLEALNIPGDTPIATVNGFEAYEKKREAGKIDFGEKPKVKPCLSFWYLSIEAIGYPLVAEFSFDYDVLDEEMDRLKEHPDQLELFPLSVLKAADCFFKTLQNYHGWFDFEGTTKTAFAYSAR